MNEYIIRETGSPGIVTQEIVGELVRCKECKHSKYAEPGMVYCPFAVGGWVEEAHFCADGERKDDE